MCCSEEAFAAKMSGMLALLCWQAHFASYSCALVLSTFVALPTFTWAQDMCFMSLPWGYLAACQHGHW
jgi:hypothetical protein